MLSENNLPHTRPQGTSRTNARRREITTEANKRNEEVTKRRRKPFRCDSTPLSHFTSQNAVFGPFPATGKTPAGQPGPQHHPRSHFLNHPRPHKNAARQQTFKGPARCLEACEQTPPKRAKATNPTEPASPLPKHGCGGPTHADKAKGRDFLQKTKTRSQRKRHPRNAILIEPEKRLHSTKTRQQPRRRHVKSR